MKKIYIITKWIAAESVLEALQKDRKQAPDDICLSDRWLNNEAKNLHRMVGMKVRKDEDDEEDENPDKKR